MPTQTDSQPAGGIATLVRRVSDAVYFFERGVVTAALLLLAVVYFYDIVSVEIAASDHAFDRLIYRFAGYDQYNRPDEAFRSTVKGLYSPLLLSVLTFGLGYLAVYAVDTKRRFGFPARLGLSAAFVVAAYGVLQAIAYLPSVWLSGATLLAAVVIYGLRAHRGGFLLGYALAWIPGAVCFGWLMLNITPGYSWGQDLGKLLIMVVGFVGASMATREKKHIEIDFIRKIIPDNKRSYYNAFSHLITIIFCCIVLALAVAYLVEEHESGSRLSSIPIRGSWIVFPIPYAMFMMVLRFSVRFVSALRGEESELGGEVVIPKNEEAKP